MGGHSQKRMMSRRSTMVREHKKINPRKIPRTQEDVDRAMAEGRDFGMEFVLNLVLFILKDKHDAPDEDIMQLRDEFMYTIDSVNKRYLSYADIVRTLKSDYDLSVHLRNKPEDR